MAGKKSSEVATIDLETGEVVAVLDAESALTMNKRQDAVADIATLDALRSHFGTDVLSWDDIEPSFPVIDKSELIDKPFVIAGIRMNESQKYMTRDPENAEVLIPGRFLSCLVATYDENGAFTSKWSIVNDGSTGFMQQIIRFVKNNFGPDADDTKEHFNRITAMVPPIKMSNGLRLSEYPYEDEKGNVSTARTYYLS